MENHPLFLAGERVETPTHLNIKDVWSGEIFSSVSLAGVAEIDLAVESAHKFLDETPLASYERSSILKRVAELLSLHKEEFALLITKESGKPLRYSSGEVSRAIDTFSIAAEEAKRLPSEYISLDWSPVGKGKEGLVRYFPVGVVAGITPFNFPLNLVAHKLAPAIAAGCPVVLKPASATPLTALRLAELLSEAGLPKGALSVLPCDRNTGDHLVTHSDVQLLSFTGSPEVGWKMKSKAGKKKVVLELGGNAGVLIADDADLPLAIDRCLVGGFAYSGQVCIHAQRIFVESSLYDKFLERFLDRVKKLNCSDPYTKDTDVSCMIDEGNAIRVEEWVTEALEKGAQLLAGGKRKGNFFEPTVLTGTNHSMKVYSEEVFGPVVVIERVSSFQEGIKALNDTRFGLQCGVFTASIEKLKHAFSEIEVGGVIHNDVPTFRVDHMPYGGIKDSGLGREGVKYAMMDMLEPRLLVW